ncbi:hypothetical protein Aeqsu_1365 [Aequorivita sublithincola DSM 14238]|uniref:DUF4270 domain-containing protein n=1 Tax=Aequorivita sublithincola (strain DSM 14238 / LMG 21431 / ACAM 643 / 9-3) TaxID=746697 RepID=I3YV40_AEQSU|nr:DUF4270 domain-containing protein [Aequorivita sublithincola]AFL80858.1 hypothetical protein Aeqsu_1365 [Aequorivita sublithincola DSM 14238]
MKIKNLLPIAGTILFMIIAMSSCQEDISTIGSELLGDEIPNGILDDSQTVISYSRKLGPVQSNRLPAYQLGVYNDPVYGKSTVKLLSQLTLEKNNPTFGDTALIDSVFVYLPFFSTATTVDSTTTYELDSIYGNAPINVNIYKSDYFLRDYDPNSGFQEFQNYYTDQSALFQSYWGEELGSVENFIPSNSGFILNKGKDDEEKLGPGLRVKLDSTFFQDKFLALEGKEELRNSNNFKNYIRGLYFDVSTVDNDGSLFIFDAANANVTIFYSSKNEGEKKSNVFKLNFGGINVNTFQNQLSQEVQTAIANPNIETGDENLYLRGGDGIISVVELFGKDLDNNGVADDLELLRSKKWIINEANLIFYVNQDLMVGGVTEPERILIYDLKNSNILADYLLDPTNGLAPINALTNHYGRLERGSDGNGNFYKMKITSHISNLINKDSTNVPLGIMVSQNVTIRTTQKLQNPMEPSIKEVPSSAVVSPEGTILYGNATPNQDKRLKLQIYYTEPK